MDSTNNQPGQRDIVYCHGCENEWFRDEHGLTCPECASDFTEIVEAANDPRADEQHIPADTQPVHDTAPDPDEDDIDDLQWEETGPGRYRVRGRYRADMDVPRQQAQQPGGLMGMVGNMLHGMIMGQGQGQGQDNQQGTRNADAAPTTARGSPPSDGQPRRFVHQGQGAGFSYTIASSSNTTFGGSLFPRNTNGPQPRQNQPEQIEQMLTAMMQNIGAAPRGQFGGGPTTHPYHDHDMHPGFAGPFVMGGGPGGPPGQAGFGPFGNLMQLFGVGNGVAGDAVYTQEALDRIMTQLMEQHQAGNAPGPASDAAIQSLPDRAITLKDQGENGKAECSICMDEVELDGIVTVLPCTHWFHRDCIKAWLTEHDTCPHCRQGIMPKEGEGTRSSVPRSPSQTPLHDMRSPQYTRPANMPGAYPFPAQNAGSGSGTAQSPYVVPDSPGSERRRSANASGGNAGVFGRMRETFGRGSGGAGGAADGRSG